MTLRDKVGQLFVCEVHGTGATTTTAAQATANHHLYGPDVGNGAQLLAKYHLGGVIYFGWAGNLAGPQQIAALSNGLQRAALSDPDGVPLQISTDQEGGVVNRIGAPLAVSPGNMAIGAAFSPRVAYDTAKAGGTELRALGITVDDAPVVDVNTEPANSADGPRSFGDDPATVAALGTAAVDGYRSAGVAAQVKHFPGLGDTTVNTDNGVAVTDRTRAEIMAEDVPPFRAAITAGVQSVMAAHIVAPALDPSGAPASLSRPIVTGLLRDTLHYDGVVITDSLSAAALGGIAPDRIVLDAINAGDDELLMPADLPSAVATVLTAVHDGTLSTARIDQSVYRILREKYELGLFTDPYTTSGAVGANVGTPAHLATMADAARRSMTLLRNDDRTLPLAAGRHVLVTGWGASPTTALAADLTAAGVSTRRLYTGSPDQAAIDAAVAAARATDVTVVTTYNAWGDATQRALVDQLLATGRPVVVVTVGGPYDLAYFPGARTCLAAYGYQPVTLSAVSDALLGTAPTGHLPVTVPDAAGDTTLLPYGSGLPGYGR
ncbi:glycoside hydrolase family 3 protein [Streptantibioticus silvisoli]|uniref:beta-N-acetylhexosaminidase n=1 Tax=Streptantibioticus silvisoli TaxID=2705255 RepID=A0ABT6VWY2_9ACTN|nr:glycoside hydrolase family 3 protein [Streptantibioticus silvisoli]MDI5961776.1 glycoside hydrolase family 3 protein [Streptantibioticus silvisoli]